MRVIGTDARLIEILPQLRAAPWVGLDTEADSLHAYPEKLCLVQVSVPKADWLIDPLAGVDLARFWQALEGKELLLHGADYDLRLMYRTFGFVPSNVFDTMWAARLLGSRAFSLRDLVARHLGHHLEKGPQKMNWALRPLPPRMAAYAVNDTHYLHPLSELLRRGLTDTGRLQWHHEVCANLVKDCARPRQQDTENLWRIKGSDRLEPAALAVLRELWHWRESEARASRKPPYFVLSHEKLIALAVAALRHREIHSLIPRSLPSARAASLIVAVERGLRMPPAQYPKPRRSTGVRLTREQQRRFDELKLIRDQRAEELGLDSSVIASKADLITLVKDGAKGDGTLMRWQMRLLESS
jgi:ribonuclease D